MKKLTRIGMTEEEKGKIAAAVEAVGAVLARFGAANQASYCYTPEIKLTVKREFDYNAEHPWPQITAQGWMVSMTAVGNAFGATLDEALDGLFGLTEPQKKRELAEKYRQEAKKCEAEAEAMEKGTAFAAAAEHYKHVEQIESAELGRFLFAALKQPFEGTARELGETLAANHPSFDTNMWTPSMIAGELGKLAPHLTAVFGMTRMLMAEKGKIYTLTPPSAQRQTLDAQRSTVGNRPEGGAE